MPQYLKIGETVAATVHQHHAYGLQVKLAGGRFGSIREREISWDLEQRRNWRKRFVVGTSLSAMVLDSTDGQIELSLRFVEADPWQNIQGELNVGQLVSGVVTGVTSYGVFIQIAPGIIGLLHKSEISIQRPMQELFWVEDCVYTLIESVEHRRRRVSLSISELRSRRWPSLDKLASANLAPPSDINVSADTVTTSTGLPNPSLRRFTGQKLSILLVEDQQAQREAVKQWLNDSGHNVHAVECVEEAEEVARTQLFELILSDVELPGVNGIEGMPRLRKLRPQARYVLMTDWSKAEEFSAELEIARNEGVGLLIKPILPEDFIEMLYGPAEPFAVQPSAGPSPDLVKSSIDAPESSLLADSINAHLMHLHVQTNALKCIVFRLDPYRRQVEIVDEVGSQELDVRALPGLIYSPVRDVAEDHQVVEIQDVLKVASYTRNLLPLLDFSACLGIPLSQQMAIPHALFLFFKTPDTITQLAQHLGAATAIALAGILEKQAVVNQSIEMQRTALMGVMMSSLIHEINNRLGPINLSIDTLRQQYNDLHAEDTPDPEVLHQKIKSVENTLDHIHQGTQHLARTTRLFGRMAVRDREERIVVSGLIQDTIALVNDTAKRAHIIVNYEPSAAILVIEAQPTQVEQVLLNVLLNAIQQIQLIYPQTGGQVVITAESHEKNGRQVARICIEDDGPGIHKAEWDQVFNLGFTTRSGEGSGIGLFIARRLIQNMQGDIYVAKSEILWGTVIEILIPLHSW